MRTKHSDIVVQVFLAVVAVVLVGLIVYYVFNTYNRTSDTVDSIIRKADNYGREIDEYEIMKYDGEDIRGSEVVNFIKKNLGDYDATETAPIYVEVVTVTAGTTYTNTYTNKKYIDDMKNFSSLQHFIKQTAYFHGEVIKSPNEAILGIKWVQK